MAEVSVKEAYEELRKKYGLPEFAEFNRECELSTLDVNEFLLRNVAKKIEERFSFFQDVLAEVLNPDIGSIQNMHESRFFEEKQKEQIFIMYQQIMIVSRSLLHAEIAADEETYVVAIKEAWEVYPAVKKELITLAKQLKATWIDHVDPKTELHYLG